MKRDDLVSASTGFAQEFLTSLGRELAKYVESLVQKHASPYRLSSIRSFLDLSERFICEKYNESYKINFAIASSVLDRFERQSMVMFNDDHAYIVIDRDASPDIRFYWVMHECAHIISSFGEWEHSFTPDNLLALNYEPRTALSERAYFRFAIYLYQAIFGRLKDKPPTKSFRMLSADEVFPLVEAFSYQTHGPFGHPWNSPSHTLEADSEAFTFVNEVTSVMFRNIQRNLTKLEKSTNRIELSLGAV